MKNKKKTALPLALPCWCLLPFFMPAQKMKYAGRHYSTTYSATCERIKQCIGSWYRNPDLLFPGWQYRRIESGSGISIDKIDLDTDTTGYDTLKVTFDSPSKYYVIGFHPSSNGNYLFLII